MGRFAACVLATTAACGRVGFEPFTLPNVDVDAPAGAMTLLGYDGPITGWTQFVTLNPRISNYVNNPYTATAALVPTVGYLVMDAEANPVSAKLVIYHAPDGTLVAVSEPVNVDHMGAYVTTAFPFLGAPALGAGEEYFVGVIATDYVNVPIAGSGSWEWSRGTAGTYASPPATVTPIADGNDISDHGRLYIAN